ncbi:undecaprenyl-diphosphate phosphatase [Ureibacillus sp. FSL K6-8385]|uniref:Undecaprenyl-diphosphatase n=1 Tax=Ureibacillus terrenus TaxID=118246 RepID=A0A540V594_9BACL|nr:undecaprenyl-diphosphate phosphatase [Ureibacillus terrenus]MED3661131.1 undecaprenyl-diphosphate phosphatase [Ureibacillus terrenus]MED3764391.1 undecaprenyl-diphosphate phosphatase [Ureibacillus terrenus]TQE91936.1 undecaprenyl-diphosphate phosphatase [Ureibacillus terrenus]
MEFIDLLKALILGFVEGMTEFAPVSSTGHMIIVDDLWLKTTEFLGQGSANTFKVVIQLGSILAVVVVMWKRMLSLVGLYKIDGQEYSKRFNLLHVFVGILPAGVFGFLFEDYIDNHLFRTETVIFGLVVGALWMIFADKFGPKRPTVTTLDKLSYGKAFKIGLIQCLSLWPGFSRSGATIAGGVVMGLDHKTASDFTFIMAVPIMAGASGLSLVKNWDQINPDHVWFYVVGFISAFIFALIAIKFFLKLISRIKLVPFALYRLVLAAVLLIVLFVF